MVRQKGVQTSVVAWLACHHPSVVVWLALSPSIRVEALKETHSIDPIQWPDLIFINQWTPGQGCNHWAVLPLCWISDVSTIWNSWNKKTKWMTVALWILLCICGAVSNHTNTSNVCDIVLTAKNVTMLNIINEVCILSIISSSVCIH